MGSAILKERIMKRAGSLGYMVKGPGNVLSVSHGAWGTRNGAIKNFMRNLTGDTWKKCYAAGYRVVIVHITEQI